MADNLVIVESPAKAKTIEKYLGSGYQVLASYGHVRDLPRSDFAILDAQDPSALHLRYEVPERSKKHVAALRKAAKGGTRVWLATDLDREGEAIAWHVAELLDLDVQDTPRVVFDEITQEAIQDAFASPRTLDTALVDAQQARRAVDRIVGYRLSPVLWRTVSSGISAGRVQSVALRLIVDREDEIRAFTPQEYWTFDGILRDAADADAADIATRLYAVGGRRVVSPKDLEDASDAKRARSLVVGSQDEADALVARARDLPYTVGEVKRTETRRRPKPPFKTSSLQGEASKIGFSARQTMAVAQQLYEGIDLGGEQVGLITYMRTDSVNLSDSALGAIGEHVRSEYGERYTLGKPRRFAQKAKGAQEAHEAIRPTSIARTPARIRRRLSSEQARLYELIWKRTLATQMADAVFDRVSADVEATDAQDVVITWRVSGQVEKFDGWLRAYRAVRDEDEEDDDVTDALPQITEGQDLALAEITPSQSFTTPPPRFSERTLVETLEELGIGRPSTYASIISTLEHREYVLKESRRFFPTPLGEVVTAFLTTHFPEVVDVSFTARMEDQLDEIATGVESWGGTVVEFLDEVDEWVRERKPERPRLPLRHPADCPECGAPMERVFSGKSKQWFASCSRWPECEGTLPLEPDGSVGEPEPEPEPDEDVRCPDDDAPMLLRTGKYGRFYGCVNYPKCKGIRNVVAECVHLDDDGRWQRFVSPTDGTSSLERRRSRYGKEFVGSTGYPDDQFAVWSVPTCSPCPTCGAPLRFPPKNRNEPIAACANPEVEHLFEFPDFAPPEIRSRQVVFGVPKLDPNLGGQAIEDAEPYEVPELVARGERTPAKKKKGRGKKGGKGGKGRTTSAKKG